MGIGLGAASVDPSGFDDYTDVSLIGDYQHVVSGKFFLGGEIELGAASGSDDIDDVSRARLLAGIKGEKLSVFAALGVAKMRGAFADATGENTGTTIGLGIEAPVKDRFKLRLELLRDSDDTGGTVGKAATPDWDVTTVRVGAFYRF